MAISTCAACFADHGAAEEDYFARTRVFPIMHLLVMRRELAQREPHLPMALFNLFDRARRHALATLADADAPYVMLPWQVDEAERTRALMGDDYWPYGVENNRPTLDTFLRYLSEQGLLARSIEVADLFAVAAE